MRYQCLVYLLLVGLLYGQAAPPTPSAAPPAANHSPAQSASTAPTPPPTPPEVKPDDGVITIKGFCPDSSKQGDSCQTVITRAQFDKLADALQPNMSPPIRRQLATRYAMAMRMAAVAEKRGLDKTPAFEEKMLFARLQILAQSLSMTLQEDSNKISDEDIADYYKKNEANFEQATLMRIFVPRAKQITTAPAKSTAAGGAKTTTRPTSPGQPTEAQRKASEEAMTKLAETIRARAAKGEDTDKLQKEAFAAAGMPSNAVNTKMEKVRRNTLPPDQQSIMDLKPGEVSQVIDQPNGGHYIYKMVSKETLSLEAVTPEIKRTLASQRYREAIQGFQNTSDVQLNEAYFGPARNPMMPPPRGVRPQQPIEHNPAEDDKDKN
jgi:PPIC-type PPIASE domain